eukprot:gene17100-8617_t
MDETSDLSGQEQICFCIRIANDDFSIEEIFFGLYETLITTSDALFTILEDVLLRMQLDITKCRGQCYDGAANDQHEEHQSKSLRPFCPTRLTMRLSILDAVARNGSIKEPKLTRQHKVPRRIDEGTEASFFPVTAQDLYGQKLFTILDSVLVGLTDLSLMKHQSI